LVKNLENCQDTDAQDVAGELFLAEENYVEAAKCFEILRLLFSKGI